MLALLLWAVGLLPRLLDIFTQDPQGDELLWNERSTELLSAALQGDWSHVTSHLGHPGIPAAVAMALAKFFNSLLPAHQQLDPLNAARLGNAALSSLIVPFAFLTLRYAAGTSVALITALFLVVDVQLLAISRLAHIDSSLAVMTLLSATCYLRGSITQRVRWKLLAGFFWGLALASKPTAVALIPAFLLFNLITVIRTRTVAPRQHQIVEWADIWAVLLGLGTLASLFTRFWEHNGPFLTVLDADSVLADWLYTSGMWLQEHALLPVLVALAAGLLVKLDRRLGSRLSFHLARAAGTTALLIVVWALVPAVMENFVRYFVRLPNLAHFVTLSSGYEWSGIPGGYFGVIALQVPTYQLICFLAGALWLAYDGYTERSALSERQKLLFTICGAVFVTWLVALNISSKQFVRYVIPVLWCMNTIAAYGVYRFIVTAMRINKAAAFLVAVLPIGIGASVLAQIHPMYLNYYNSLLGGLPAAAGNGYPLFYRGQIEALRFLEQHAAHSKTPRRLAVVAEYPVIKYTYDQLVAPRTQKLSPYVVPFVQEADYVIAVRQMEPLFAFERGTTLQGLRELYTFSVDGVPMTTAYEVAPMDFKEPLTFKVFGIFDETGGTTREDSALGYGEAVMVYAMPERHTEGTLLAGGFLKILPGKYAFSIDAAVLNGFQPESPSPARDVLAVSASARCARTLTTSDLASTTLARFTFECEFPELTQLELKAHWFGKDPIVVDSITIKRRL